MSNKKVVNNFFWRFAERVGAQLVTFLVSVILARLLEPEVYGNIALITVFITILNVFIDSGMANALIQKKNADNIDFSTVFYFNMTVCCILYIAVYLAAPVIAAFYENHSLIPVIRVLSLTLIISGLKNVQQAYVSRTMQFKKFFFATLGGTVGAAAVGIFLAYRGAGIWALVAQQLFNTTVDTIVLWFTVKWRPQRLFQFTRLRTLFTYGSKLLVSALLDTVYNNIRQLIIGKMYSSEELAYFNRGKQFPNLVITNIVTSIDSVLLPTMSMEQDDSLRVKGMTRRAIKTGTCVMAPIMIGLACCAQPLVRLILTEKWIEAVPFMRIMCICALFYPIHTANLNAIKAMGKSNLYLRMEISKKIVGTILLLTTMWFGVYALAYSLLVESVLAQIINSWPNKKLLDYGYSDQVRDIVPSLLISIGMGVCIYPVTLLKLSDFPVLIIQILLGATIYIGGCKLFKVEAFGYLWIYVKTLLKNKQIRKEKDEEK
ncbi:MAG: lipopolysaccharide biosynthesis protein [Clostridia bacterium]|nr:lipopolysaccharide biosynthesis protein [Clostridia bacterium]